MRNLPLAAVSSLVLARAVCILTAVTFAVILVGCSGSDHATAPQADPAICIDVAPDDLSAPWRLTGSDSLLIAGVGDTILANLAPGYYLLDWQPVDHWSCPEVDPTPIRYTARSTLRVSGTYTSDARGSIAIAAEPGGFFDVPWVLEGPSGFLASGAGDTTLNELSAGSYSVTWEGVFGWILPERVTVERWLPPGGEITVSGYYTPEGCLEVSVVPSCLDAAWRVDGPRGRVVEGIGSIVIEHVLPGEYAITYDDVLGWTTPEPSEFAAGPGQRVVFQGTYGLAESDPAVHVPAEQATIRNAVCAASNGDTVFIAPGTYREHDIRVRADIALVGVGETADLVIIDAERKGHAILSSHYLGADALSIRNLTITNGYTATEYIDEDPAANRGGAIYFRGASLVVDGCRFIDNSTGYSGSGGAIDAEGWGDVYLAVNGCFFAGNSSHRGGAIHAFSNSQATVSNCVFTANDGHYGSAIHAHRLAITNSLIHHHRHGGGGQVLDVTVLDLDHCTVASNVGSSVLGSPFALSINRSLICFNDVTRVIWSGSIDDINIECTDIFGNTGGDWGPPIGDLGQLHGNFSLDPCFTDTASADYMPCETSPCRPENNSCGVWIGWSEVWR